MPRAGRGHVPSSVRVPGSVKQRGTRTEVHVPDPVVWREAADRTSKGACVPVSTLKEER